MKALATEIFDVGGDGEEDRSSGGRRRQPDRETELAIEISATERGVVAVGKTKAGLGQAMAQGTQHAGLASARLASEDHGGVLIDGFLQLVHHGLLRGWQPEVSVGDLLGEGDLVEAEVGKVRRVHEEGSCAGGMRPTALSSRAVGGSNDTWCALEDGV